MYVCVVLYRYFYLFILEIFCLFFIMTKNITLWIIYKIIRKGYFEISFAMTYGLQVIFVILDTSENSNLDIMGYFNLSFYFFIMIQRINRAVISWHMADQELMPKAHFHIIYIYIYAIVTIV
ncbi:hypothetical protein ACJX0J_031637, partial [Zea mays]